MSEQNIIWLFVFGYMTIILCTTMICSAWSHQVNTRRESDKRALDLDEEALRQERGYDG